MLLPRPYSRDVKIWTALFQMLLLYLLTYRPTWSSPVSSATYLRRSAAMQRQMRLWAQQRMRVTFTYTE